jgi:lipoprotein-anchoring transpeptidase ErfK/SrfK
MIPSRAALALVLLGAPAPANGQEVRLAAERDTALRIAVSLSERRLRVMDGAHDTLLVARVAVGSGGEISYGDHRWQFSTPRGVRTVVAKDSAPVWIPPDWHYVEVARREHLKIVWIRGDTTILYDDGSRLVIDRDVARFIDDRGADEFAVGEHIIVDDILYVPPIGAGSRKVPGELGEFRLSIGDGVGIHGTADESSIGNAVTHGCMRLSDADIAWVYHHVPVGTKVYIY